MWPWPMDMNVDVWIKLVTTFSTVLYTQGPLCLQQKWRKDLPFLFCYILFTLFSIISASKILQCQPFSDSFWPTSRSILLQILFLIFSPLAVGLDSTLVMARHENVVLWQKNENECVLISKCIINVTDRIMREWKTPSKEWVEEKMRRVNAHRKRLRRILCLWLSDFADCWCYGDKQ